ncbi:MAG TPA: 8-oxo-dGTP diphosphatase [Desulfurivibrionaceae bacterium]|nr:8-oxo-dGTP diphosphatase [Desulfurivibrionaceae bacterium]
MYRPIVGTLGYILSPDGEQTLLVHRNARADDAHLGKYNGLGGKMLPHEDVLTGLHREIREEAGIECLETALRGTINWTGFGPEGEDWLGFIFRIDRFQGTPFAENSEGVLSWQPISRLHELPMWEGDRYFLPLVFDRDPRIFHGHMPYRDNRPIGWHYTRL